MAGSAGFPGVENGQEDENQWNRSDVESDLISLGLKAGPVGVDRAEPQFSDELRQNRIEPVGRRERVIEQLAGRAPGVADEIGKLPARAGLDRRRRKTQTVAAIVRARFHDRPSMADRHSPVSITNPPVHAWI